jgi:hypothetical protein
MFLQNESDVRLSNIAALSALALRAVMLGNKLNRSRSGGIYLPLSRY